MKYFNEIDSFASEWLRVLFLGAMVDSRSISDVKAEEVRDYTRCHFFGGIGMWDHALRLAGWPIDRPVWTGSCPCQPLSSAGKRKGERDERHLWPEFYRLISECRPVCVFGEQVASKDGLEWLDGVSLDLEDLGYAVGSADLSAACVGAPHIRQRLFWAAYLCRPGCQGGAEQKGRQGKEINRGTIANDSDARGLAVPDDAQRGPQRDADGAGPRGQGSEPGEHAETTRQSTRPSGHADEQREVSSSGLGDAESQREIQVRRVLPGARGESNRTGSSWDDFRIVHCADGKARRVPVEPELFPLAHGHTPDAVAYVVAELVKFGESPKTARRILREAGKNRTGVLKGAGNAIVPQVAALFIRSFMDVVRESH